MLASVRAMFSGIIDYAGMFPPAQLPLEQAIRNYARYRTEPESWMLGRFVCPAAELEELSPFVEELFGEGSPLSLAALGRTGKPGSVFLDDLRADLECVAQFRHTHGDKVAVDVFETRVTPQLASQTRPGEYLYQVVQAIDAFGSPSLHVFLEPSPEGDWLDSVERLAVSLYVLNSLAIKGSKKRLGRPWFGFKLRCGGTQASMVPSIGQIAYVLSVRGPLPFKATAGLHHPLRQFDHALGTHVHGFLNVWFAALALATKHDRVMRGPTPLPLLLEDENAANFKFTDEAVSWRNLSLSTELVAEDREQITSFGSCSFDEPREGLRELGLIP
jgi:hypothetical protein